MWPPVPLVFISLTSRCKAARRLGVTTAALRSALRADDGRGGKSNCCVRWFRSAWLALVADMRSTSASNAAFCEPIAASHRGSPMFNGAHRRATSVSNTGPHAAPSSSGALAWGTAHFEVRKAGGAEDGRWGGATATQRGGRGGRGPIIRSEDRPSRVDFIRDGTFAGLCILQRPTAQFLIFS